MMTIIQSYTYTFQKWTDVVKQRKKKKILQPSKGPSHTLSHVLSFTITRSRLSILMIKSIFPYRTTGRKGDSCRSLQSTLKFSTHFESHD